MASETSYEASNQASLTYNRFQSTVSSRELSSTFSRLSRNRLMYAGVDGGQWPADVIEVMQEAGYPIHTINFTQGLIDTALGHVLQSPTDVSISTTDPQAKQDVSVMQTLYDIDHASGEWAAEFKQCFLDGFIQRGWIQLLPVEDADVRGNVGIEAVDPAHIFVDPFWISDDPRDIREMFKSVWMTPESIKANYNLKGGEVDAAIDSFKDYASNNPSMISTLFDRSGEFYDSDEDRYKVIERHYIVDTVEDVIVDTYTGKQLTPRQWPEEAKEMKGPVLKAWLASKFSDRFKVFSKTARKSKFITICPALGLDFCLERGDYPYQLGQVPFFPWSYRNVYGEPLGMVDLIADAQIMLNKRESQITKILNMRSAGNWSIESDAFDDDPAKLRDAQARITRTGEALIVTPGTNSQNKIKSLTDNFRIDDLRQQTQVIENYLQKVTNITPAMQGQLQSKQESGILYEQMQSQSMTVMEMTVDSIKNFMVSFGQAYIKAAISQYGEDPRELYDRYSGTRLVINQPQWDPQTNDIVYLNELGDTDWYAVSINTRRLSEGFKKQRVTSYAAMLNAVTSPAARAVIEYEMIKLLDISDESEELLDRTFQSQYSSALMQQEAQKAQAQIMINQAQQPPQMPGQGPGGMPAAPKGQQHPDPKNPAPQFLPQ